MAKGTKVAASSTKHPDRTSGASDRPSDAAVEVLEHALTRVARAILRLGVPPHALRAGEQIDRSGYWVLMRLDESQSPVRLSDLAGLLELDLSTVSRQTRHLVDAGLVVRESDPGDGRACLLSLSERGRSVLDAVRDARRHALGAALGGWPDDDRVAIATALSKLADDLAAGPQVPAGHATTPPATPIAGAPGS
jgi:DNA-binding MarR family transcriptional regulator